MQDFRVEWDQQVATCPQGQHSVGWTQPLDHAQQPTVVIRFAAATCRGCEVRQHCTRGQGGRTLTLRPPEEHAALQQRRAEQRHPAFVRCYGRRAGVEGTISQAVRTTRLRRTPYVGLRKTHLHHLAIAAGLDLKRIAAHLQRQARGQPSRVVRPLSPLARLPRQEASA